MNRLLQPIAASRRRSSGFSPSDLSPALWLDANDSSTLFDATSGGSTPANGENVRRWEDKSTNARHVTEGTFPPTRQTGAQNSRDVVRFSGSRLAATTAADWKFLHDGTIYHVFAAVKYGTSSNVDAACVLIDTCGIATANRGATIMFEDRTGPSPIPVVGNNASRHFVGNGTQGSVVVGLIIENAITPNTFVVHTVKGAPSASPVSGRSLAWVNGSALSGSNASTATPSSSNPSFTLVIGASNGGQSDVTLSGDIGELIIVPGDLTTQQRTDCESYLQTKWLPT